MEPQPERSTSMRAMLGRVRRGRRDAAADATVPATAHEVWALVSDVERIDRWWPRAKEGVVLDGEGLGRLQRVRLDWGKAEGRVTQRVTAWQPGGRYGWTIVGESADDRVLPPLAKTEVTVEIFGDATGGSRVRIAATFDPANARGALALRQMSRMAKITYRKALSNLAAALTSARD